MPVAELLRRLVPLFLLAALSACAAALQPMGAPVAEPRLDEDAIAAADGYRLPLRRWMPARGEPRAVVLALHGFNDYSFAFEDSGRFWAQLGIATFAIDQRGFGEADRPGIWAGTETLVADVRMALGVLGARYPGVPLYLLGESMGGAVAILAATRDPPPPIDGLILAAPAAWGRQTMDATYQASLWFSRTFIPGMTFTGEDLGIQASDNIPMLVALGRDPLFIKATRVDAIGGVVDLMTDAADRVPAIATPTLVLLGEHEEVLDPRSVNGVLRALPSRPDVTVASYSRGWHMVLRDLGRRTVQRDLAAWILQRQPTLPSGAEARGAARLAALRR